MSVYALAHTEIAEDRKASADAVVLLIKSV